MPGFRLLVFGLMAIAQRGYFLLYYTMIVENPILQFGCATLLEFIGKQRA